MKIGILTFHCAHNYGAVLQCYATQEFLRSKGYDVEIINYRPKYLLDPYKLFNSKRLLSKNPISIIKGTIRELILFPTRLNRWLNFEKFINHKLILSNKVKNKLIPSTYDVYIVGSDQIWNPLITKGFDEIYFCNFSFIKGKKKYIAYAASMESKILDNNISQHYYQNLLRFDAISVRETDLLKLLQPLLNVPIVQVLDPTLMISPYVWYSFPQKLIKGKYVLVYEVRKNSNTIRIARHIAKQIGAQVKVLVACLQFHSKEINQSASPEDFVNYVRNASCVVTTSFHGTAFSIIFNRPFYTVRLNDGADSRSASLLKSVDLEDRLIDVVDAPEFTQIEYLEVNRKINILRDKSQNYILKNLKYE